MGKDKEEKKAKKAKREDEDDDEKAKRKAEKKAKKEAEAAAAAGGDEKAAKKEKKEKKKREAEEADDSPAAKKSKGDDGEEKVKLSKEEKAAKKAAKKAKEEGAAESVPPPAAPAVAAGGDGELNRVFVGNLPFSMTDDWMKEEFASAGTITKVEWLTHADTGRFKGAGFLTFETAAMASAAVELSGKELEGRPMKAELAKPKTGGAGGGAGFANNDPGEPSESVFVGNLSWSIDEAALRDAFKDCGEIARIKWVEKDGEWKGICFVDFETVDAATKAVALNGTDISGRPVRLNFSKPRAPPADKWGGAGGGKGGGKGGSPGRVERPYKPAGPKPDGCVELFCGNLSWTIDEDKVKTFFAKSGATVTGTRWLNDKESGEFKGIGFVTFADSADVDKAVSQGGDDCDGRPIRLDYAGQKPKPQGAWGGGGKW